MKIIYTDHARERMDFRGISEDMVREALVKPDREEEGHHERYVAYKRFKEGTIKVVYVKDGPTVIVSVIWHSKN